MSKEDAKAEEQAEPERCFICDCELVNTEHFFHLFGKRVSTNGDVRCPIAVTLSSILSRQLEDDGVHPKSICDLCNDKLEEYEQLEQRFTDLKYKIVNDFNKSSRPPEHSYEIVNIDTEEYAEITEADHHEEHSQDEQVIDESSNNTATEDLMTILCTNEMKPHQITIDSGESRSTHVKVEPYHAEITEEEYFDQTAEQMVEIIAENDESYIDIIEENHTTISNDGSTFLEVIEGGKLTSNPDGIIIKVEDPSSSQDECILSDTGQLVGMKRRKFAENNTGSKLLYAYNGQKFTCKLCMQDDTTTLEEFDVRTISVHLKSAHNIRTYICDICGQDFGKRTKLTEHMDEEHGGTEDGEFQCETCNRIFTNLRLFRVHKRLHYASAKSFECVQCNKKYSSKNLLDEHMNMHTGKRPYKCQHCPKDFASKYTLTAHLKIHSERERPYSCKECPKSFFSLQNLQQHERTHSGVKNFICQVCKKAFGTQHNLEVHKIVHTGYKPFICRTCGKAFARRAEIKDHERTHTGEKPFTCDICNMSFAQRSNLTTHKRATHLNDKRYKCDQCDRSFKRRRLLDYHIRATHTGERPYKCNICNATFVYPEHFKKHTRIHTGLKPYACDVCGKTFNSRDNRNAHRYIHSDKKPYECVICGQGFMRKPLAYAHMQQTGHFSDTIIVNPPNVKPANTEKSETNSIIEENITEDSEMAEEHLIIDGPVQFGADSEDHIDEETVEENSMPSEILEEDFSEVIDPEQVFVTEDGHYIKTEDGTLIQIRTKDADGKEGFAWVNFVTEQ